MSPNFLLLLVNVLVGHKLPIRWKLVDQAVKFVTLVEASNESICQYLDCKICTIDLRRISNRPRIVVPLILNLFLFILSALFTKARLIQFGLFSTQKL